MIRVDLLGRQRRWSPWSKALLSALILCGGLYGIHLFFPALVRPLFSVDSILSPAAQQGPAPSPVVQQESTPEPTAQQETTPSPVQEVVSSLVVQQEIEPEPMEQQETSPSSVVPQEGTPKPVAQQEAAPKPVVVQQEALPSPGVQQETTSSPVQKIESKPAAQQETTAQQESIPSPVQEIAPSSVVQREATPRPSTPASTPSQTLSSQRSTACFQVMRIDKHVPTGIRVASLSCNSRGEYWLEGTSPSHKVLRTFRLSLQALPSWVSFSTWREERTLRFAFQGRFAERDTPPLDALPSDQAEQFFSKVVRWANASGLDSLSIQEPIHRSMSPARTHQRQKLQGLGSSQQIDAFLQQLQQAEAVATLGEVLLLPVKSDERGWVQARLYAAVDIIVDEP